MHALLSLPFAVVGRPLFGNQWLALLAVLAGVAVFMLLVAAVGRWLAATHPDAPPRAAANAGPVPAVTGPTPEVLAVIAAAVATTLGASAQVAAVQVLPSPAPTVESLMVQWSLEGRRQIYTSHKVR